jgi:hypothetical protein
MSMPECMRQMLRIGCKRDPNGLVIGALTGRTLMANVPRRCERWRA